MDNRVFKRYEIKYLLNPQQKQQMMEHLLPHTVPDVWGDRVICNIYYDTPDYRLIRHSLEHPIYKEKLRLRCYGKQDPQGECFLELKKKYEGVVYKRRIVMPLGTATEYMAGRVPMPVDTQIGREIDYTCRHYENLRPAVYVCYDREAFYDRENEELRITFDRNIRFRTMEMSLEQEPGGTPLLEEGSCLMEIKAAGAMPMWLVKGLNLSGARKSSFSKYGTIYREHLANKVFTEALL